MKRRAYLTATAALVSGFSGCIGARVNARDPIPSPVAVEPEPIARSGIPPTICEEEVIADPGIYAVVEPAFGPDWNDLPVAPQYGDLTDETAVVGVERSDYARAYPLRILWHHEIVNDALAGPFIATYCPLCRSGLVAERRVAGEATVFRVSGLLWRPEQIQVEASKAGDRVFGADLSLGETEVRTAGNLVMVDDATGSYWSQLLAQAICGSRTGDRLDIVPSSVARWGEWQAAHPDTDVLLPPPHSVTV